MLDILLGMLIGIGIVAAAIALVFGCLFLTLVIKASIDILKHM